MIPIPNSGDDITADWLTAALQKGGVIGCRVVAVEASRFGVDVGMLSSMVRCRLQYDAPSGGEPASVVVKLEPDDAPHRNVVDAWHGFEREIRFYREVAPLAPIQVPRFFFGDYEAHGGVIVLEDLGHLKTRNQIHGLTSAEVRAAAKQIARLHARFWNDDASGSFDWMPVHDPRLTAGYAESWDSFVDVYGLRIGQEAIALGNRLCNSLDWVRAELDRRPRTICHGDFRADNMLFGNPDAPDEVVVIDWQVPTRSIGTYDLARLLGGSEPPAERRAHHMEGFTAWHESLRQEGLLDYTVEEALDDFRFGVLLNLCTPVRIFGLMGADPGGRRGQLLDAIATRFFACALEVDAAARFP